MSTEYTEQETADLSPEVVPKEQFVRLLADFENYKKDQSRTAAEIAKWAGQSVIIDMIDSMDLVQAAVAHAPDAVKKESGWYAGLEHVERQFAEAMKKHGVLRIETTDKVFDPTTMEAVSTSAGGESNKVHSEIRAGYMLHDRVIRPARVIIYQ